MKKWLKITGYIIIGITLLLTTIIFAQTVYDTYNYNIRYSITMPKIVGQFNVNNDFIQIWGLNNIINDDIATLTYSELSCIPSRKYCSEKRISISGLGNRTVFVPTSEEYIIRYNNKNTLYDARL